MKKSRFWSHVLHPNRDLMPLYAQQGAFLVQTSEALVNMVSAPDQSDWKRLQREIRSCEVQGDALLTEFRENLTGHLFGHVKRSDLTTIAMALDDCLDVIKDASNALLIYQPRKIDQQLADLAQIILQEALALQVLLPLFMDIRRNASAITLQCDRVTELEHAADEAYEDYIGFIFKEEEDFREMTKYKNLAELFEKATDSEKHVSDCVRITVLKYLHD